MTTNEILIVLKTDLQISATQYDTYLTNIITLAKAAIQREGIVLKEIESCTSATDENAEGTENTEPCYSVEDGMLIAMYSAYIYRKRKEANSAMPRMLRYELNQRLFSQKGSET